MGVSDMFIVHLFNFLWWSDDTLKCSKIEDILNL
jgi:hypothetical protein